MMGWSTGAGQQSPRKSLAGPRRAISTARACVPPTIKCRSHGRNSQPSTALPNPPHPHTAAAMCLVDSCPPSGCVGLSLPCPRRERRCTISGVPSHELCLPRCWSRRRTLSHLHKTRLSSNNGMASSLAWQIQHPHTTFVLSPSTVFPPRTAVPRRSPSPPSLPGRYIRRMRISAVAMRLYVRWYLGSAHWQGVHGVRGGGSKYPMNKQDGCHPLAGCITFGAYHAVFSALLYLQRHLVYPAPTSPHLASSTASPSSSSVYSCGGRPGQPSTHSAHSSASSAKPTRSTAGDLGCARQGRSPDQRPRASETRGSIT